MLKTKSVTLNLLKPSELSQRLKGTPVLSSQQIGWNGILVEQYQHYSIPGKTEEKEIPALSDHWLILPLGHPVHLSQKSGNRLHESIFQKGDSLLVPARKPTYWRCPGSHSSQTELHIHLQPESIEKVAKASQMDTEGIDLANHFRVSGLAASTYRHAAFSRTAIRWHNGTIICRIVNSSINYSSVAALL